MMLPPVDMRHEFLRWADVDVLIDHLLPQFNHDFDGVLLITSGGMITGGILAEAMGISYVLTASVHFASNLVNQKLTWPTFIQFPSDSLLTGRRILIVDDIWSGGRTIVSVRSRVLAARASAETAVLHYRPKSNLFPDSSPDYFGAVTDAYIIYPWESPGDIMKRQVSPAAN